MRRSKTDWARVDALRDEEIDLSNCPEVGADMFRRAVVRRGLAELTPTGRPTTARTVSVTMRFDIDVITALRATGAGWQARARAALRAAVLGFRPRLAWTPTEDRRLRTAYRKGGYQTAKAAFPNRTEAGVRQRASFLGITAGDTPSFLTGTPRAPRWAAAEDRRLRAAYRRGAFQAAKAAFPGRTDGAIRHRASVLGITARRSPRKRVRSPTR